MFSSPYRLSSLLALAAGFLFLGDAALGAAPEPRKSLPGSVKELAPKRTLSVQRLSAAHVAQPVEFQVSLKMRNFAEFTQRIQAGERIAPAELAQSFLPTAGDYQALVDWAKAEHLTIVSTDPMRLGLFLSGTVGQIQQALQTEFARVSVVEGTFTSAVTAPSLPGKVAGQVLGINGLQPHVRPHRLGVQPQAVATSNPPYLVKEILAAYGAANLAYTGAGEKIAVLIDTFPRDSDLTAFWSHNNVPQSLANIEKVQVVNGTLPPPEGEETLDVEWSSGIAPQAKVRIYATKDLSFVNVDKGFQRIINDLPNQPQLRQLSISLGLGESYVSASQKETDAQYMATLASQGVTVFVSSGDSGSNEGGILQVSYFASDPSVTGVGGTSLRLYSSGAVNSEAGWSGSGGGLSTYFARPSWQIGTGLPAGSKRAVPDVALVADPNTGAYVYLNGAVKQIGGTSWSAPVWAGFSALINQARKQNGRSSLGALNRQLYPLLGTTNFRDVTAGSNGAYPAKTALDLVTGLGVPAMNVLLPTLAGSGVTTPSITSFSPSVASVGTDVHISGLNLDRTSVVRFNGSNAAFAIISPGSVRATVPAGATSGPLSITTPSGTATSGSSFTVAPPATNDHFAAAQLLSGTSGQVTGSNVLASGEAGEPMHAGNSGGASVWYEWTAPTTGTYTFETNGSSFDTLLAVYTGETLSALALVAANDDAGTSTGSSATFGAIVGTVYRVAVDGYSGSTGSVSLEWAENSAAPVISSFTPQTGTPGTTVQITGANLLGATAVTFGNAAAAFAVDSDAQITATVPANGATGAIVVTGAAGSATSTANFVVVAAASNDRFIDAAPISAATGSVTGNNAGATKETGEPEHASNGGGKSVWFSWTAPAGGTFTFETSGSSFDTLLAIYTGSRVDSLAVVAENDDAGSISTSSVSFNAVAGANYRIAVDGFNGAGGNLVLNWTKNNNGPVINSFTPASGPAGTPVLVVGANFTGASAVQFGGVAASFTIDSASRISATVPAGAAPAAITVTTPAGSATSVGQFKVTAGPANDAFNDATVLSGTSVNVAASTVGASKEAGEPAHAGNPGGRSVWWRWTAPADGSFAISTQGSGFDTLLGVYLGQTLNGLTAVGGNDDDPAGGNTSVVSIKAIAGTTYQIAVDGLNGASGSVALSIYPQEFSSVLYATGFEPAEGFTSGRSLAGEGGWKSIGTGGNGISRGEPGMTGQQAYVGRFAPNYGDTTLHVWQPLDYVPASTQPIVKFSVAMAIEDSFNQEYDDFQWRFYNRATASLFTIDFNNYDLGIYYQLDGQLDFTPTGHKFSNGVVYKLEVTIDFGRNRWSATLNGNALITGKPIRTGRAVLDLGAIAATWQVFDRYRPGNNYLVFDDYSILAQQDSAPRVTFPPQSKAVTAGDPVSFSVVATGLAPLKYQWLKNGVAVAGATASSYTIPSATSADIGWYTVTVTNPVGKITSSAAALSVKSPPAIVVQPVDLVSAAGRAPAFKVSATGTAPLAYQWFLDGAAIPGATRAALTLPNVQPSQNGSYTVRITNSLGSLTSHPASLTVGSSFASVRGPYNALLASGTAGANRGGMIKLTMTSAGSFSGSLSLAGQTWRLLGTFDHSGRYTRVLGRDRTGQPVAISLQAGLFGSESITGTLSVGSTEIPIGANRDPYDGINRIAPQTGRYTFALPAAAGLPSGHGYATLTVSRAGAVRAAGRLGDFTTLSVGASVDAAGAWPLYAGLYASKGYVSGVATFRPLAGTDLDAALQWYKPPALTGMYRAGFEGDIALVGSAYQSEPGVPVLTLDSSHRGTVAMSGPDLTNPVNETVQISTANRLTLSKQTAALTMALTPTTGAFSGVVKPNGARLGLLYSGVVLQKSNLALGVLRGSTATGTVAIEPATP